MNLLHAESIKTIRDWIKEAVHCLMAAAVFKYVLVISLTLSIVFSFLIPFSPIAQNMMDLFTFLDGAYRIRHGQVPHVDFYSSLGSLTYVTHLAALAFSTPGETVFTANLVFLGILLPIIVRTPRVVGQAGASFLVGLIVLAVMVPINIDFGMQCLINYNTGYNRWGSATLLLTFVFLLRSPQETALRFWHIVFLLALTFFLKVNFFVVTLGAFVLQCILYRRLRKEIIWGFLTFALALLVLDVFTGMIRGYLRDIGLAAAVNQGAIIPLLAKAFSEYFWVFMPAVALLGVQGLRVVDRILRHIRSTRSPLRLMLGAARPWLLCGYVIAGTLLSESQNLGGIGPMPLAALFFAPRLSTRGLMARLANVTGLLIPVFALVPWLWVIAGTGACIGRQVLLQRSFAPITDIAPDFPEFAAHRRVIADQYTSARLEADRRLRDWVLHRDPRLYVFYFREMSALLAAIRADYGASLPPTRTLDFADPVPALLGSKPAPGAYIALHYLRTISDVSYIPAETYFSGIALVFVPRCALFELNEAMVDLYRPYLKLNFRRRALTPCWDVYERGSPAEVF